MKKIISSNSGVSAVEFALISPLLFVLIFGIIEFGALLYNKAVITNASREGARFAAGYYTNPATATTVRPTCEDIQTVVVKQVLDNAFFLNFTSPTPFNDSNVTCPNGDPHKFNSGAAGYVDTISINYDYKFLVFGPLVQLMNSSTSTPSWSTITLKAQTAMRSENQN